jgi:hypothetical protein
MKLYTQYPEDTTSATGSKIFHKFEKFCCKEVDEVIGKGTFAAVGGLISFNVWTISALVRPFDSRKFILS